MKKNKDISLINTEKNQAELKSELSDIKIDVKKSGAQKNVIKNVENFYDSREAVITFYKDYSFMVSNAAYDKKNMMIT